MKKKLIYIITPDLPYLNSGGPVRYYNLINYINKRKYRIKLFTILGPNENKKLNEIGNKLNIKTYGISRKYPSLINRIISIIFYRQLPYSYLSKNSKLDLIVKREIEQELPDIIHIEHLNGYFAIESIISYIKDHKIKIILDNHNVEYIALRESLNSVNIIKKMFGIYIYYQLKKEEIDANKTVDFSITCSKYDKKLFSKNINSKKIIIVPNGAIYYKNRSCINLKNNNLIFMGNGSYPPNDEALKFYFKNIHYLVKSQIENVKIYILGSNQQAWLYKLAKTDKSIIIKGFVNDVKPYLNKASVAICPLKSGSGTRLKVLEYLGSGKAVVSTSKGVEGIEVKHGDNILISNSANQFAENIINLIKHKELAYKISKGGIKLIMEKYQWGNIVKNLEGIYE